MNVALTYLEMSVENGLSERQAIRNICDEIEIGFSPGYVSGWKTGNKPIPPKVAHVMQQHVAHYAALKAGLKGNVNNAKIFANLLSPFES